MRRNTDAAVTQQGAPITLALTDIISKTLGPDRAIDLIADMMRAESRPSRSTDFGIGPEIPLAGVPDYICDLLATVDLRRAARDPRVQFREAAARSPLSLDEELIRLAEDPEVAVRRAVADRPRAPQPARRLLMRDTDDSVVSTLVNNLNIDARLRRTIATRGNVAARRYLAASERTSAKVLKILAGDSDDAVRTAASERLLDLLSGRTEDRARSWCGTSLMMEEDERWQREEWIEQWRQAREEVPATPSRARPS